MKAFYELLSQSCLSVVNSEENKPVAPVELCPILKTLYNILIARYLSSSFCVYTKYKSLMHHSHTKGELQSACLQSVLIFREVPSQAILQALRDQNMNDPRDRIAMAQTHAFYIPSLLGQQP